MNDQFYSNRRAKVQIPLSPEEAGKATKIQQNGNNLIERFINRCYRIIF